MSGGGLSGGGLSSGGLSSEKQKQNENKMKSEMSKNKKRKVKVKDKSKKSVRLRPINFDFGQFRLRPAGRSRIVRSRIGRSRASSEKGGAEGWGGRNFALFFPSPATIFFLLSLGGPFVVCSRSRGIRGPRPPSVHWEKAPRQEQRGGRWRQPKDPVLQQRTTTTRGAPRQHGNTPQSAPGPRLKTSGLRPFQDPDSRVVATRDRVSRLERALEAMGDSEGKEVDGFRAALEKTSEFAKGVPLDQQIKDGEVLDQSER